MLKFKRKFRRQRVKQEDRHCAYNLTLRRVRAAAVVVEQCVFVALGIQHAMRKRHIVVCGLPRSAPFFHIIS